MTKDDDDSSSYDGRRKSTLARIAELLGEVPGVGTRDIGSSSDMSGASELLSIWVKIEDDEVRRRLLEFARELAMTR